MLGWECCDKWEFWFYNYDFFFNLLLVWLNVDYIIVNNLMFYEVVMF